MDKRYKEIFTPYVARRLLRMGNPIVDIKPDKNNRDAKLTEDDVINILQLHKHGISVQQIAEQYPVAECTIYDIIKGNTWKHINRVEIL